MRAVWAPNAKIALADNGATAIIRSTMDKPKITAWMKPHCGWSNGVRAVLRKYDLPFEDKDIINNPAFRWEMEQKSGQPLQPTLEIDGKILADVSGEELERWLLESGIVQPSAETTNVPLNSACTDEQHAAMRAGQPVTFKS
jgi:monothiol glutaredoxin